MRQNIELKGKFVTDDISRNLMSFEYSIFLNSNDENVESSDQYSAYDFLIAVDALELIEPGNYAFENLQNSFQRNPDWHFGFLSYDLKNQIENLDSYNADRMQIPLSGFFIPRFVFYGKDGKIFASFRKDQNTKEDALKCWTDVTKSAKANTHLVEPEISAGTNQIRYIENCHSVKKHIRYGDIYEMNYCLEFFSQGTDIDTAHVYNRLNNHSPMPFSAFLKMKNIHAVCASPERFIARRGNKIISQPIKGTAPRGKTAEEDEKIKNELSSSLKERSENIMITDLVRNDLSRTAAKGSVKVEELCGVYTFKNLHHMISTVVSEQKPGVGLAEILKTTFPMGSMTGAPKIRAMELIEEFEDFRRGLYSGSIGYISPNGDFDFNVVIRTVLYNSDLKVISFMAGSAITTDADPEKEYRECLLKAESMMKALGMQIATSQ